MVVYTYNAQFNPPAPLVHVTLRNPKTGREVGLLPGQVDTAADRTVLPQEAVEALGLVQMDLIRVAGVGGAVHNFPTYLVQLQVRGLSPLMVEAASAEGEKLVLVGRDVLNQYRVVLDGPNLRLEIDEPGG